MPISAKSVRIGGSLLIAVLMVALGYILPGLNAPKTKTVNAELTDDLLAAYVAKDSDSDNLPDWQEVLYGTDANKADTDGDGINDGEAVRRGLLTPTSLASQIPEDPIGEEDIPGEAPARGSFTEKFSQELFESFVRAGGGQSMDDESREALLGNLLKAFRDEAAKSLTPTHTRVSARTDASVSIVNYAGEVERVINTTLPTTPDSDLVDLAIRTIENDDKAAQARLTELSDYYMRTAAALLALQTPPSLVDSHLQLVRSIEQAGRAAKAIGSYEDDPLLTMGAISVLLPARLEFNAGITGIAEALVAGGEPASGNPGAEIVEEARRVQQQ